MSALPITPPEPAETPRVPGSRITRRLGWINGFITRSNDELADETHIVTAADLAALDRTARRLEATRVTLIAKADRQRTFTLSGSSSTSSWVATTTRVGGSAAAGQVALASALEDGLGATKEALTAGQVSVSAGIITTTMRELPEGLTETERASVETALVKDAERLDPGRLRRAATSALAAAHRSVEEVAEHQGRVLADQERRAYARSFITMFDQGDGTTTGRFLVPTGTAKVLGKVLQSMTAPRRDHLRTGASPGSPNGTGSLASLDGTGSPDRAPSPEAGPAGQVDAEPGTVASGLPERNDDWAALSWAEKKGRAFAHLLEHLPTDQLTGRTASTVVITMTLEQVLGAAEAARLAAQMTATTGHQISLTPDVGAARTDNGHHHSTGQARRLACTAGFLPAVLDAPSVILDLGRQERLYSDTQRVALAGRRTVTYWRRP